MGFFDDTQPSRSAGFFDDTQAPPKPRGWLGFANDTVISAANQIAGGVGSIANAIVPGNRLSQFIDEDIVKAGALGAITRATNISPPSSAFAGGSKIRINTDAGVASAGSIYIRLEPT